MPNNIFFHAIPWHKLVTYVCPSHASEMCSLILILVYLFFISSIVVVNIADTNAQLKWADGLRLKQQGVLTFDASYNSTQSGNHLDNNTAYGLIWKLVSSQDGSKVHYIPQVLSARSSVPFKV